jgi:hypothetical protein
MYDLLDLYNSYFYFNNFIKVVARWLLPMKKKVKKEHLSDLYIAFLLNGADISKFFSYVFEEEIITDSRFVYFLLGVRFVLFHIF